MNGEQGMQTNGNDVIIETRDLKKLYQMGSETIHALAGVDMKIRRNEYIAIMGPSGSGKSTLMNLIGCLDTPTEGEYVLNGSPVQGLDDDELARIRNREIGFVFQTFNLLPRASALHNVELPLIYAGVSSKERQQKARNALGLVDLADRALHKPNELSGGQRQRVAIARVLLKNPAILVFDEATSSLDSQSEKNILSALTRISRNKTTLVIAHRLSTVIDADRIIVLDQGQVKEQGDHETLVEADGLYAHLWRMQQKKAQEVE